MEQTNDKTLFGVMTIIFHCWGVPYFMRSKKSEGIKHIILSIVTCGILACVYEIQGIIRGIKILQMPDDAYMEEKYSDKPSFISYH